MTKLRQKMGIFGFWSLGLAISAVACGSSFDSEDCRASRTCAQAGTCEPLPLLGLGVSLPPALDFSTGQQESEDCR